MMAKGTQRGMAKGGMGAQVLGRRLPICRHPLKCTARCNSSRGLVVEQLVHSCAGRPRAALGRCAREHKRVIGGGEGRGCRLAQERGRVGEGRYAGGTQACDVGGRCR